MAHFRTKQEIYKERNHINVIHAGIDSFKKLPQRCKSLSKIKTEFWENKLVPKEDSASLFFPLKEVYHNALVHVQGLNTDEVIARTFIWNWTKLPFNCVLKYGGKEAMAGTILAVELIRLAAPSKPVHIYLNYSKMYTFTPTPEAQIPVKIESVEVNQKGRKRKLGCIELSPPIKKEYMENPFVVHLDLIPGLNIIGKCSEKSCPSNWNGPGWVVRPMGYVFLIFTPFNNKLPCPYCNSGQFTPSNFLLCKGRSLFRFKNTLAGPEVAEVLLESTSSSEIAAFCAKTEDEKPKYDAVEIKTVAETESPYFCVACGDKILQKKDEFLSMCCGLVFHSGCYHFEVISDKCAICSSPFWTADLLIRDNL